MPEAVTTKEKVDELKQNSEVQKALDQTAPAKDAVAPPTVKKHKFFLTTYILLLLVLSAGYYLIRLRIVHLSATSFPFFQRLALGSMAIVLTLAVSKSLDVYFIRKVADAASEYNIRRIVKLVTALVIAIIVVSIMFAN